MASITWVPSQHLEHRVAPRLYAPALVEAMRRARTSGLKILPVGKACTRVYDGNHGTAHPREFTAAGPLFIRNSYFSDLHITDVDHISENDYRALRSALKGLKKGCVLVAIKGDVGRAAIYMRSETHGTANPPTAVCFPRRDVDEGYLAVQFEGSFFQEQIQALANSKSTRPEVSVSEFRELRILVPSSVVQRAIGNKVRKAERLREIAKANLEDICDWTNRNAASFKLPRKEKPFLEHFPAATIRDWRWVSDLSTTDRLDPWPHHVAPRTIRRHIIQHGTYEPLRALAKRVTQQRKRMVFSDPEVPGHYVSVLDVDFNGRIDWGNASQSRYAGNGVSLKPDDVLYSCINPQQPRVGVVRQGLGSGVIVGSPEFAILRSTTGSSVGHPNLLATVLRTGWVRVQASFATRSSSLSRRRLDESDLDTLLVPWSPDGLDELEQKAKSAIANVQEASALIGAARAAVESLIEGSPDDPALLAEGDAIEQWLAENPSPDETEQP